MREIQSSLARELLELNESNDKLTLRKVVVTLFTEKDDAVDITSLANKTSTDPISFAKAIALLMQMNLIEIIPEKIQKKPAFERAVLRHRKELLSCEKTPKWKSIDTRQFKLNRFFVTPN